MKWFSVLRQAAFSSEQAKSLTSALKDTVTATSGDLATKADLLVIRNEIAAVKSELKLEIATEIASVKSDIASLNTSVSMLKWGVGIIIVSVLSILVKSFM